MKKLTKVFSMVLALSMMVSMAACGSTPASSSAAPAPSSSAPESSAAPDSASEPDSTAGGNTYKVGVCIYQFDDNFMTLYRQELERYLTSGELGDGNTYEVSVVDGKNDQAEQTNQIDNFISQGVDALILNLVQTTSSDVIINKVKDAGIPTVFINREPTAEQMALWDQIAYVGADASQSGTFQGEIILETETKGDINGDGKVSYIMIQGDPENIDAKLRTEYSIKALTDAGMEVEQLDMQRGDWKQERGQEITATDLSKFGDKVEVVFCNNDAMALGAAEAIKAAGRTVGKDIYLVGVDALDDAVAKVKSGEMSGTVLNDANGQSHKAAEVMSMLLSGQTVEKQYYVDYVKVTA